MTNQKTIRLSFKTKLSKNQEFQQLLIQSVHKCAIKFPNIAASVVHVMLDYLGESSGASGIGPSSAPTYAVDIVAFVREVLEKFPELRAEIMAKLLEIFTDIKSARVLRGVLWLIGEYSSTSKGEHVKMNLCVKELNTLGKL